jgi:hypothetical protein
MPHLPQVNLVILKCLLGEAICPWHYWRQRRGGAPWFIPECIEAAKSSLWLLAARIL